ncbi:FAD-dependent oxidoreductase [Haliea sp. E17]|uniref:FAD-dependent oxidoreductase n=1 Tax=Haliea sp. E17 TaxID=3401576 RepID=UPI003AAD9E5D
MSNENRRGFRRRQLLASAGALAGIGASSAHSGPVAATAEQVKWDRETDVVCVGSGAAACAAAITARQAGAEVILLEKMPLTGGTTLKSSGVAWIPNHPYLRARGIEDRKEDCLRYLARYAYPQHYTAESPTLGLSESNYRLLEAFYDNGSKMVEFLQDSAVIQFQEFTMWGLDTYAPDYADHLPENKVPRGRAMEPASSSAGGGPLATTLVAWLENHGVPAHTDHRVTGLVKEGKRVVGVEVDRLGETLRIKARRGVIFGTGGYAHNAGLISEHQTALYGSCAMPGATGDFIAIAGAAGAAMGGLHMAWRSQVQFEEAVTNRFRGLCCFVLPGDSMIVVNKYGRRVTNEKRNYNDRTRTHFYWDPTREEYTNHLQFMVFDQRSLDAFGGAYPLPTSPRESRSLIRGETWDELVANIGKHLENVAEHSGGVKLDENFAAELQASRERFNGYAKTGVDKEFQRGSHAYDADWHKLFSARRAGTAYPENPYPSLVMHPFAEEGPYYAIILAAGALDTCGGPQINHHAQVLDVHGEPIPGLYGAGNCIASPTRQAYAGAGGTIGPALTFGYIAGRHVTGQS